MSRLLLLITFIFAWRAQRSFDNQEVAFLHLSLASSSVVIKKGDPVDAQKCVLKHKAVLEEMCSVAFACKFADVLPFGLPMESMPVPC